MNSVSTKRIAMLALASSVGLSQTACLIGAGPLSNIFSARVGEAGWALNNINWGLVGAGVGLGIVAGTIDSTNPDYNYNEQKKILTTILGIIAIVLDEENPGRIDALNPIPMNDQSAKKLKITRDQIQTYNDEIPEILETDRLIVETLAKIAQKKIKAEELDHASRGLGVENAKELEAVLKKGKLDSPTLTRFAEARQLSPSTARVYLQGRFGIQARE